ncbi:MAG: FtsQ-type POTRA domain-containing protein [Bacteroidetes bacterium]|nr:FtsQ-type POTRA domain-containing protein [Bacteroidota bacterium]
MAKKQLQQDLAEKDKRSFLYSKLLTILIIVGGIFALSFMWKSKQRLQTIEIVGIKTLTEHEILEKIGIDKDEHPFLRDIQLAELRIKIKQHPFVRSATVAHGDNGKIIVTIEERLPVAALKSSQGELRYIDRDGVVLPYRLFSVVTDVPLVHGINIDGKIDTMVVGGLVRILNLLENTSNGELYQAVSEVFYQQNQNSYYLRSTESGIMVNIGYPKNLQEKIDCLIRFWKNEFPKVNKQTIEYIDLRWQGQLILKKRTQ